MTLADMIEFSRYLYNGEYVTIDGDRMTATHCMADGTVLHIWRLI